jgi:phage host-nuclease inhibitor protein Gam
MMDKVARQLIRDLVAAHVGDYSKEVRRLEAQVQDLRKEIDQHKAGARARWDRLIKAMEADDV